MAVEKNTVRVDFATIKPMYHKHRDIVMPSRLVAECFGIPIDALSKRTVDCVPSLMDEKDGKYFYLLLGKSDEVLWTQRGVALIAHYAGGTAWECYEKLQDTYFSKTIASIKSGIPAATLRHFSRLTEMVSKADTPFSRQQHINTLRAISDEYGIEMADTDLLESQPQEDQLVAEFFANIETIQKDGKPLNHHTRNDHLMAINLNDYFHECGKRHLRTPRYSTLKRALHTSVRYPLIDVKTCWSAIEKRSIRVWTFDIYKQ